MTGKKNQTGQVKTKMIQGTSGFSSLPFTSALALFCAKKNITNSKAYAMPSTDFTFLLLKQSSVFSPVSPHS